MVVSLLRALVLALAAALLTRALAPPPSSLLRRIRSLVEPTGRGVDPSANAEITATINQLRASAAQTSPEMIEGTWELLWTTERETLFLIKSGLLGSRCTSVQQAISKDTLRNSVFFERDGSFEVEGSITRAGPRTNFKFRRARLRVPPFVDLPLPPVGQGWFDTIYADKELRVSFDVRGDYLVCRRTGP